MTRSRLLLVLTGLAATLVAWPCGLAAAGTGSLQLGSHGSIYSTGPHSPKLQPGRGVRVGDLAYEGGGAISGEVYLETSTWWPDGDGTLGLGPCGSPPAVVVAHFAFGASSSNLVRATPDDCITTTVPVHLALYMTAYQMPDDSSGYRYFPVEPAPFALGSAFDLPYVAQGSTSLALDTFVPPGSAAVAVWIGGTTFHHERSSVLLGCPQTQLIKPGLGLVPYEFRDSIQYVRVTADRQLCLSVQDDDAALAVQVLGYFTATESDGGTTPPTFVYEHEPYPAYRPTAPERVLDTRVGIGAPATKVLAGQTIALDLRDHINGDTDSAVLNVTATETDAAGYVTVYPCGGDVPTASNLNYLANQSIPNSVIVPIGAGGAVCIFTYAGAHLVADLSGTYEWGGGDRFFPVEPVRISDTRNAGGKLPAGQVLEVPVAGASAVPPGATAVTVNVTATDGDGPGYLTAFPCDRPVPVASNVNYATGQDVANHSTVRLSADGRLCVYTYASVHVVVDLAGYYADAHGGAGVFAIYPTRRFDSRGTGGIISGQDRWLTMAIEGSSGLVANVTVAEPDERGYLTLYSGDRPWPPPVSSLNYRPGQTVANQATVRMGVDGHVTVRTSTSEQVIIDVSAYMFTGDAWYPVFRE